MKNTPNIDLILADLERHEDNLIDLEDIRFGEIYLEDTYESGRKRGKKISKQRKMRKETYYE